MQEDASNFALKISALKEPSQLNACIEEIRQLSPATRAFYLGQIIHVRVRQLLADHSVLESVVEMLTDPSALDFFEIEEMVHNEAVLRKRVMEALEVIHHFE